MKKLVDTISFALVTAYCCIAFVWAVTMLFGQRFSDSVLSVLTQGDNLLWWPLITVMFYAVYLLAALITLIVLQKLSPKTEDKMYQYIAKIAFPASIISAMIITLTPEQFDIISTLISFLVVLRYFVPNNGKQIINELRTDLFKGHKETNKNDKDQ